MKGSLLWVISALAIGWLIWGKPPSNSSINQPNWFNERLGLLIPFKPSEDDFFREKVMADDLRNGLSNSSARRGNIVSLDRQFTFSQDQLNATMRTFNFAQRSLTYHWKRPDGNVYAFSAESIEQDYYFAPAFLTGWQPFEVNYLWQPWYAVAHRMRYARDSILFAGRTDVWQTGYQSWQRRLGDCEDHALLLADWLINMGEDARVVLGQWNDEGHAWVILFRNNQVYLLEPTRKFGRKALREYPLASLMTDYRPQAMFNREIIWVNSGSMFTTNYSDGRWKKASTFYPSLN